MEFSSRDLLLFCSVFCFFQKAESNSFVTPKASFIFHDKIFFSDSVLSRVLVFKISTLEKNPKKNENSYNPSTSLGFLFCFVFLLLILRKLSGTARIFI